MRPIRLVSLDDVRAAAASVAGVAVRTPLLTGPVANLWVKPENLQPIGAFKLRGALHALASLPAAARAAGVITHSSGNHAQALAYAARRFGVPCLVVMPDVAAPLKIAGTRALGAEIVLVPPAEREARTEQLAGERGMAVVPPFDDRMVIAGQGTVGLEIVEDLPSVACVLVPVGGGGLASGVATAVKACRPEACVIGVEPELAADAAESLREGRLASWPTELRYRTVADGLRTGLSELTFAHLRERLDGIVTVTEAEILSTVGSLARDVRVVSEPSGAVAAAGWIHHADAVRTLCPGVSDGPVVAVISGGNIDPALLATCINAAQP